MRCIQREDEEIGIKMRFKLIRLNVYIITWALDCLVLRISIRYIKTLNMIWQLYGLYAGLAIRKKAMEIGLSCVVI